ncbi:hypothetical protein KIW84_074616 [Lathyrus oleraceus]|uniref:Uncharacterized protein n=1 Tax=Pisum sativum TaxID=3888 RepID=A0A9D4VUE3_PEA|nr:hypothetical protein KIW84_074616 [Pisum sativum]
MTLLYGACGALSLNPRTKDALEFSSKDWNPFWFIITTPVKPPNKEIMEESSEKSKIEAIVPAKSDQQVHNLRNKRAEMERYIPKPVAKEMAQQECSQRMVSSISQAPVLHGYRQNEASSTPASAPATPGFPVENDPLLFSLANVELITEPNKLDSDVEWNTLSMPGPQKLPVRKHVKHEGVMMVLFQEYLFMMNFQHTVKQMTAIFVKVGMTVELSSSDRVNLLEFFKAVAHRDGRTAAECTLKLSREQNNLVALAHINDPHHKVAQAARSALADIVPACRKPFEGYMERMFPHVFSRPIDPKEVVRQPCSATLEIVSQTCNKQRSPAIDEQRSPKAKLAVFEFAVNSFDEHTVNAEVAANIGILNGGLLS